MNPEYMMSACAPHCHSASRPTSSPAASAASPAAAHNSADGFANIVTSSEASIVGDQAAKESPDCSGHRGGSYWPTIFEPTTIPSWPDTKLSRIVVVPDIHGDFDHLLQA